MFNNTFPKFLFAKKKKFRNSRGGNKRGKTMLLCIKKYVIRYLILFVTFLPSNGQKDPITLSVIRGIKVPTISSRIT